MISKRYDYDSLHNRDPVAWDRIVRLLEPALWRWFRPVVRGLDRIPEGAALFVGNHNAATLSPDTFVFAIALYRERGLADIPYGLAHQLVVTLPGFRDLLIPLGAVRASHENAHRIFAHGGKVLVYPGGDLDAWRPYRHRNRIVFGDRRGYIRLALRAGVPIVPVVTAGAHETLIILDDCRWLARLLRADRLVRLKAWPLTLSIPWGITVGPPLPHFPIRSQFFQEVLDPIEFERSGEDAAGDDAYVEQCNAHVVDAMQDALARLAADRLAAAG